MSSKRPLRAVAYVRLSVHRGDADPSTSPERQEEACRAYALAKGWDILDVVQDLDVSGSDKGLRLDRPGLRAIRDRWDEIDVVIFSRLDRLARNVVDFRAFADEAAANGASLVSIAENLDLSTSTGRFVATILAAFAEMEAAAIAERTRGGRAGAAARLRWAGGSAPYGYRTVPHPDGAGRALAIEPQEAEHVRRAAQVVLGGGSLYSALRLIHDAGARPRRAAAWSLSSLRVTLTGDAISGRMIHRGEVMRGDDGLALQVWEPVLDYATLLSLREVLAPTARTKPKTKKASRLLSGLLVCETCGATLRVQARGKTQTPAYSCRGKTDGTGCDRAVSIGAAIVDEYVGRRFVQVLGDEPEFYIERREVETGLGEVEEALSAALAAVAEDDTPEAVATLQGLQKRRAALLSTPPETVIEYRRTGRTLAEAFGTDPIPESRAMLAMHLARPIVVSPGVRGRRADEATVAERLAIAWRAAV